MYNIPKHFSTLFVWNPVITLSLVDLDGSTRGLLSLKEFLHSTLIPLLLWRQLLPWPFCVVGCCILYIYRMYQISSYCIYFCIIQEANALLVAGSTLAFWIHWQTPFCSWAANLRLVQINAHVTWWPCCSIDASSNGSIQLTHMSHDDPAVQLINWSGSMAADRKTKQYYSTHLFATRVSFGT